MSRGEVGRKRDVRLGEGMVGGEETQRTGIGRHELGVVGQIAAKRFQLIVIITYDDNLMSRKGWRWAARLVLTILFTKLLAVAEGAK